MTKNSKISTLFWVIIILSLFISLFYSSCNSESTDKSQRWVRKNIHSSEAIKDIEALNRALKIMREKDCKDPLSWYYQGAIHWIPDTIKNNQLCSSYSNVSELMPGWDNCTHTPSGQEKIHFLVWHRLYIWHFEKIVRKLSGYQDFALPYWGYEEAGLNKCMPDMFTQKGSSLYESCRYDSLNLGYPINGEILRGLDLNKLMSYSNYRMFCLNINVAPHGAMHDYIGAGNDTSGLLQFQNPITNSITNTGLMGWVPTAAFDPIFWTHHSNIDRIWQKWTNSPNGVEVTLEELQSIKWPYVFFDENGDKVEYKIEEVYDMIYNTDYDFDDTPVREKQKQLLNSSDNSEPKVISIDTPGLKISDKLSKPISLPGLVTSGKSKTKLNLELTVSFTKVPKGIYEVYVNLDEDDVPSAQSEKFAGYMTFFGADHKMQGESCKKGCCRKLNDKGRT